MHIPDGYLDERDAEQQARAVKLLAALKRMTEAECAACLQITGPLQQEYEHILASLQAERDAAYELAFDAVNEYGDVGQIFPYRHLFDWFCLSVGRDMAQLFRDTEWEATATQRLQALGEGPVPPGWDLIETATGRTGAQLRERVARSRAALGMREMPR